jgi:hypothetical protein
MRWLAEKNLVRVSIPGGRRLGLVLRSLFTRLTRQPSCSTRTSSFPYVIAAPFAVLWQLQLSASTVIPCGPHRHYCPHHSPKRASLCIRSVVSCRQLSSSHRLRCKDGIRLARGGGYDVEFELREVSLLFRGLRIHHLHGILVLQYSTMIY